jgi:Spy/CpxP family protein refolding chaperone
MKDGFESLGRVRLQGVALLAIAFVGGALGGMAAERIRARRALPPPQEWMPMRGGLPPGFEQLNLTPEQQHRIQTIFRSSRPRTDSVLQASLPRLEAIRDSVRAEIRAVLTPEQQRQFDEMEMQGPRGGPRGRRGGPGPGPGPGFPEGPPMGPPRDSGPPR